MTHIYDVRLAGATEKSFKEVIAKLRSQERAMERVERKLEEHDMTPKEMQAVQSQRHLTIATMPARERDALQAEIDQMWAKVPEHRRDRAFSLLRGK